jgi:hypothetical protein
VHCQYPQGHKGQGPIKNMNLVSRSASPSPTRATSCWAHAAFLATPMTGIRSSPAWNRPGSSAAPVPNVTIYKARLKRGINTRRLKRALKRRNNLKVTSAIEPVIGHLKNDGLRRRYLKGELGDAMHAILCGAGHNIRLILRQLRIFLPWLRRALSGWLALEINPFTTMAT